MLAAGDYTITASFTPADADAYQSVATTAPLKVISKVKTGVASK